MKMVWLSSLRERKWAFAKPSSWSLMPLVLIGLQLLVELLDGADCQAGVPDCVALDLVGDGLGPVG